MKNLKKEYNIVFSGLKLGEHEFTYKLTHEFFEEYGFEEFLDSALTVHVNMKKSNTMLEFSFDLKGEIEVECDLTLQPFWMTVSNQFELVVKFGEEFNDDDDEILILPHGAYEVNIAQYVFELAALSAPTKRIHPDAIQEEDDDLDEPEDDELDTSNHEDEDSEIDPRWNKLKDLLN